VVARVDASPDAWTNARERYAVRDYNGAILLLEESIADGRAYADAYNLLGLSLAMLGRQQDALRAFDQAVTINPRYVEAQLNRAVVLNDLGREEDAREAMRIASRVDRADSTGYPSVVGNRLANAHSALGDEYRGAGAYEEAIAQYERALELRPGFADIRLNLARALVERGRLDEASTAVETVLQARPGSLEAMMLRGMLLYLREDYDAADAAWAAAGERHPTEPRVAIYRSMLARRRASGL
jgi:tetratricopeptide (TPR) repeat protein